MTRLLIIFVLILAVLLYCYLLNVFFKYCFIFCRLILYLKKKKRLLPLQDR